VSINHLMIDEQSATVDRADVLFWPIIGQMDLMNVCDG